jgi:hypothetical protein
MGTTRGKEGEESSDVIQGRDNTYRYQFRLGTGNGDIVVGK